MQAKRLFLILTMGIGLTLFSSLLLSGYPAQITHAQSGTGVIRVSPIGTDTPTCGSVATPCRTVQYAIGLANPADEILVATGIYTDPAGTVAALDKSITLQGGWSIDFLNNDPALYPTTLDARRMGSVISITGQTDNPIAPTIDGFIITRGNADSQAIKGGGIYSLYADPTIINNIFTNNIANSTHYFTGDGGGLYLSHSSGVTIIRDNTFISNTAAITGGWGQGGAIFSEYSSPQIIGNVISGNVANGFVAIPGVRSIGGNGGGIVVYYGMTNTTVISGNQILNNVGSSGEHGTGGGLTLGRGAMLVKNNTVRENTACSNGYGSGGGIFLSANTGPVTITNNLVENNAAGTGAVATPNTSSRGGGIFLEYMLLPGPVVIENNTVAENIAGTADIGNGGGIYLRNSTGATIIRNNRVLSNTGSTGNWAIGGGVYISESSVATITENLIEGNIASTAPYPQPGAGGGLATQSNDSGIIVQNNTIRNNIAASNGWGQAGGYFSRWDDNFIFEDNLVENNSGAFNHTAFGGGVYLESSSITMQHNTLQNNHSSIIDGHGGGAFVYLSPATLNANTIISNTGAISTSPTGTGYGGGLALYASNIVTVSNNIIAKNQGTGAGPSEGDGIWVRSFDAANATYSLLLHNTIANNSIEGIWIGKYSTAVLTNNIISGHTMAMTNTTPTSATVNADHTLFWNNTTVPLSGTNAIFDDPVFAGSDDYHLSLGSAAIDAGVDVGITTDIDGNSRPVNGIPDIGADEYYSCDIPVTAASISGEENGYTDVPYVFTSVITPANATEPVSYAWSPEPNSGGGTLNLATYQWANPGVYTITLTVENCGGTIITTHTITIEEPHQSPSCDVPLTDVSINGVDNGHINTPYVFSSTVTPVSATLPITHTWSPEPNSGAGTLNLATYQWANPGVYTITLTAENCGGSATATHTVTINGESWHIYLPLIMKAVTGRTTNEKRSVHPPQIVTEEALPTALTSREYTGGSLSLLPPRKPEMP